MLGLLAVSIAARADEDSRWPVIVTLPLLKNFLHCEGRLFCRVVAMSSQTTGRILTVLCTDDTYQCNSYDSIHVTHQVTALGTDERVGPTLDRVLHSIDAFLAEGLETRSIVVLAIVDALIRQV